MPVSNHHLNLTIKYSMSSVVITALYKFVELEDYRSLKTALDELCQRQGIKGTLLLAREGINGTVAGSAKATKALLEFFQNDRRLADMHFKQSYADKVPFFRMKVRLKKEIVTLGLPHIDPRRKVGQYVKPKDWNSLVNNPEVLLIDTRNDYEYEVGTFSGAINPNTNNFRQFPQYIRTNFDPDRHKKVAMFCTGGIRCEKASSYLLDQGFQNVYHLEGGILNYLQEVDKRDSLWLGECFVFDQRVTVDHDLKPGGYDQCHGCRRPISDTDKQSDKYVQGVSCPRCYNRLSEDQKKRFAMREKQIQLAKQRGEAHMGKIYGK